MTNRKVRAAAAQLSPDLVTAGGTVTKVLNAIAEAAAVRIKSFRFIGVLWGRKSTPIASSGQAIVPKIRPRFPATIGYGSGSPRRI